MYFCALTTKLIRCMSIRSGVCDHFVGMRSIHPWLALVHSQSGWWTISIDSFWSLHSFWEVMNNPPLSGTSPVTVRKVTPQHWLVLGFVLFLWGYDQSPDWHQSCQDGEWSALTRLGACIHSVRICSIYPWVAPVKSGWWMISMDSSWSLHSFCEDMINRPLSGTSPVIIGNINHQHLYFSILHAELRLYDFTIFLWNPFQFLVLTDIIWTIINEVR